MWALWSFTRARSACFWWAQWLVTRRTPYTSSMAIIRSTSKSCRFGTLFQPFLKCFCVSSSGSSLRSSTRWCRMTKVWLIAKKPRTIINSLLKTLTKKLRYKHASGTSLCETQEYTLIQMINKKMHKVTRNHQRELRTIVSTVWPPSKSGSLVRTRPGTTRNKTSAPTHQTAQCSPNDW